jgi:putative pyruvate formate lyase activating enzyme
VIIEKCNLCPRHCNADRSHGEYGFCGAGAQVKIALVSLHKWEEPCLSGEKGAGTVFFSHCNLHCVFCQNHKISQGGKGIEVTAARLAEIFLEQQERGAASLDLVTPTHYVPQILAALKLAKQRGLRLPVVYNSNAYETEETLLLLRGSVDVFLPDMKYADEVSACRYSRAPGYFAAASAAICRMAALVGKPVIEAGRMKRGVIVRHLILPGHKDESMRIVDWLWQTFGDDIYISLMNQFTPMHEVADYPEINRRLTTYEYDKVVDHARELGITQCFIQQGRTASEKFVPQFDGQGVLK